jgi:hypothetical protein
MEREQNPQHVCVDTDGNIQPYSPEEVRQITKEAVDKGDLVLVVTRLPNGDLAANVFGPPSVELITTLEQIVYAYRQAVTLTTKDVPS